MKLIVFAFLMNIDISGLLIVILIFSVPSFFIVRGVFKRKFGEDKGKVMAWSIATGVLLSALVVVGVVAGLVVWLISQEGMG